MTTLEKFATLEDLKNLWRDLEENEVSRANALLNTVSHVLRVEAKKSTKT